MCPIFYGSKRSGRRISSQWVARVRPLARWLRSAFWVPGVRGHRPGLPEVSCRDRPYQKIYKVSENIDVENNAALGKAADTIKGLVIKAKMPVPIKDDIKASYKKMAQKDLIVAVRSSATAEDLPDASFPASRRRISISGARLHFSPQSRTAGLHSTGHGRSTGQSRDSRNTPSTSRSLSSSLVPRRRPGSCSPPTRSAGNPSPSSRGRGDWERRLFRVGLTGPIRF